VHFEEDLTVLDFDKPDTEQPAPFGRPDEAAVAAFGILGDLRVVAWKLGVAASSRGSPLLAVRDLSAIVDGWLDWEAVHLAA
jgi:hypothetical protein